MSNLINLALWDSAGWKGAFYLMSPEPHVPAILAPVFTNKDAASNIFKKWMEDFGEFDLNNNIRCCIISGVDTSYPMHYKIGFSPNINNFNLSESSNSIVSPSRICLMESTDDRPLRLFLKRVEQQNSNFYLVLSVLSSVQKQPEVLYDLAIRKNKLEVIDAWRIGVDSWWSFMILPNGNPIIPQGLDKAPVLELLEKKRGK